MDRRFRGISGGVRRREGRWRNPNGWCANARVRERIGGLLSDRRMNAIRGAESEVAERVQSILDDVDAVVTPGTESGCRRWGRINGGERSRL
jgi:amidase